MITAIRHSLCKYCRTSIQSASLLRRFGYNAVRAWLHDGRLLHYRLGALKHTIIESAISEASQENWDTFTNYVCLRGISVYGFKVSEVFARCVNEKVVER